jgi:phenylpropionate dioxygenase-like ring-hydroxylating dioxygenase large terminal subunit
MHPSDLFDGYRAHRLAYVDPDVFHAEMTAIFGGTWVYVAHESQLPSPNDYVSTWVGPRPVLVTRDGDGALHALVNRCRHRGVILAGAEAGNASRFRCEYHGWTYRNTGDLSGVPYPKGYGDCLDKTRLGLGRLRAESVHGFIFATLATEIEPLEQHLGPAAAALEEWAGRAPGGRLSIRSGARRVAIEANWKVVWDNSADGYHPAFTHRSLLEVANRHRNGLSLSHFSGDPDDLPMRIYNLEQGSSMLDQRPSLSDGVWAHARPVPGTEAAVAALTERYGDEARRWLELAPPGGVNISVFPNLLVNGNFVTTLQPTDVGRSLLIERPVTYDDVPPEVNWLRLRYCEDFVNFGEPDDVEMFERSQRGFATAETQWSDLSRGRQDEWTAEDKRGKHVPVSNEAPLRTSWHRWRDLMSRDPQLTVS